MHVPDANLLWFLPIIAVNADKGYLFSRRNQSFIS